MAPHRRVGDMRRLTGVGAAVLMAGLCVGAQIGALVSCTPAGAAGRAVRGPAPTAVRAMGEGSWPTNVRTHQCASDDLTDCTQQCNAGHAGSCTNLGTMYAKGSGVSQDQARAVQWFQKACDAGEADGCAKAKRLRGGE